MNIDLGQMIFALSDTLDLVGINEVQHGKRVGSMAWHCAKLMGLDKQQQKEIFHTGLLHDCGVSSTRVHENLVKEMDWDGAYEHCEIGANRLKSFGPLLKMADVVYYHHTHWKDLKRLQLPEHVSRDANLIFMADRMDTLAAEHINTDLLQVKKQIRDRISEYRDTFFQPELVDVLMAASDSEAFWINLEPRFLSDFLQDRAKEADPVYLSMRDLKKLAVIFAQIVDAKSPYTAEHSRGVAILAKHLAELSGLSSDVSSKIEIAGLLHDIGKLKVPDTVLEKPARMNSDDLAHMRHHSFESYMILKRIEGIEDIALWAGNHHEALNGNGYPFRRKAQELCIQSRIVAVSDVFQALAQNRPYREALLPDKILVILKDFVKQGSLDPDLVNLVENNLSDCYRAAISAI